MSTRRLLTAVIAGLLAGVAHAAHAADLEVRPSVAPYSWSGCYVGGNFGFGILQDGYGSGQPRGRQSSRRHSHHQRSEPMGSVNLAINRMQLSDRRLVVIEAEAVVDPEDQSNSRLLASPKPDQKSVGRRPDGRVGFTFHQLRYTPRLAWPGQL
jgi:hypothetical protein